MGVLRKKHPTRLDQQYGVDEYKGIKAPGIEVVRDPDCWDTACCKLVACRQLTVHIEQPAGLRTGEVVTQSAAPGAHSVLYNGSARVVKEPRHLPIVSFLSRGDHECPGCSHPRILCRSPLPNTMHGLGKVMGLMPCRFRVNSPSFHWTQPNCDSCRWFLQIAT